MTNDSSGNKDNVVAEMNPTDGWIAALPPEVRTSLRELLLAADDERLPEAAALPAHIRDGILDERTVPKALPRRPADSASKTDWVDYCVVLGADRGVLVGDTQHWDAAREEYVPSQELKKPQLIELADSLGG